MPLSDLRQILRLLAPEIGPVCAFCRLDGSQLPVMLPHLIGMFVEAEGVTGILACDAAEALGLQPEAIFGQITLTVHSDLNAVGLLAVVCTALAHANIPVNVVSAVSHDHLFVPVIHQEEALAILLALSQNAIGDSPASVE